MSVKGAAAPEPRPYHVGNLREAVLEASLKLIEESGAGALTLREIGNRLGVSRMAAYRHFADKSALLSEIAKVGFEQFAEALEQAGRRREGHLARLEELGVAYVRFANEHKAHFEVMFGPHVNAAHGREAQEAGARAFHVLLRAVQDAQDAGKLISADPLTIANHLWATVHGISVLNLEPDWKGEALFTRQTLKRLRDGIQAKKKKL